jgi:trimethylamine--corrinoid protein Co-methyltransferase
VGHGGHFLASAHTIKHYRNAFHNPELSDWRIYDLWQKDGAQTAMQRANRIWKERLAKHVDPILDPAIDEAPDAYVAKRKEEINKR